MSGLQTLPLLAVIVDAEAKDEEKREDLPGAKSIKADISLLYRVLKPSDVRT